MMEWKLADNNMPRINVMERSLCDLIIWDGKDYHRGFAEAVYNKDKTDDNNDFYNIKYYSHDTNEYVDAVMFLEIEPAKKGLAQNIWRTLWSKKMA